MPPITPRPASRAAVEVTEQPDVVEVRFVPYIKDGKVALRANFRRHDGPADNN